MNVKREIMFLRFARLLNHTHVVPLLRTHSVPPTHDLPLKLPHVSKVFLQQLANPQLYKLVGSGMKEKLSMFVFMDSP